MEAKRYILAHRPSGTPDTDAFTIETTAVDSPTPGQVLIETQVVSVDPYMRDRMREGESYAPAWAVGDPIPAGGVGEVIESNHPDWEEGDLVVGQLQWATHCLVSGERLQPVDPAIAPLPAWLGVLGLTGRTAYFGMLEVAEPTPGDTVLVSGAAGAVGTIACQLAEMAGADVIGIAGTDEKTSYLTESVGIDAAINYSTADVDAAIADHAPTGIDVYFDNVGGPITDAAFNNLSTGATITVCGQIALYNNESRPTGPRKLWRLIEHQASIEGFLVGQFRDQFEEANRRLQQWVSDDVITHRQTVLRGFDGIPTAFAGLFEGTNIGKLVVDIRG